MSDLHIEMTPCESSQIDSHGYHPESKTLAVKFKFGGATYHYHDVPPEAYEQLKSAESVGSFVIKRIKGAHAFTKQPPEQAAAS